MAANFRIGTAFGGGVRLKKEYSADAPVVHLRYDLQAEGVISHGTAATTADGFFLVDVITTAGTTVEAKIPFFTR